MTIQELQTEIIRLKKEKDICILAHSYQAKEICEIVDFVGDSYALSVQASKTTQSTVLMCGVRFMAETVKILSPKKRVFLSNSDASCPMAEQMDKELIENVKKQYPDYTVVAYINTTADLKTICDVCVTSSSAVKIVKSLPENNILFIPDCNLGDYVAKQAPEKNISKNLICPNMKLTTLADVYRTVKGTFGEEITLSSDTIVKARACIDKMIELGG